MRSSSCPPVEVNVHKPETPTRPQYQLHAKLSLSPVARFSSCQYSCTHERKTLTQCYRASLTSVSTDLYRKPHLFDTLSCFLSAHGPHSFLKREGLCVVCRSIASNHSGAGLLREATGLPSCFCHARSKPPKSMLRGQHARRSFNLWRLQQ
jgi:hypothetical protein